MAIVEIVLVNCRTGPRKSGRFESIIVRRGDRETMKAESFATAINVGDDEHESSSTARVPSPFSLVLQNLNDLSR